MTISFNCPECGHELKVPDTAAGKRAKCMSCLSICFVPDDPASPPVRTPPPLPQRVAKEPEPKATTDDETDWAAFDASDAEDEVSRKRAKQQRLARAQQADQDDDADEYSSDDDSAYERPIARKKPKKKEEASRKEKESDEQPFHFHWVFLVALLPLVLETLWPGEDFRIRLERDYPGIWNQVENNEFESLSELLDSLPEGRVRGAFLRRDSSLHWLFALFSAAVYLGLLYVMFPGSLKRTWRLLGSGLFTGTVGIGLLLLIQILAYVGGRVWIRGINILSLIQLILMFIRYSYDCTDDPDIGFWGSFFGFTFGVGLCEELCKSIPIIYYLQTARKTGWRGACLVGLASGIGFGVAEGIMYSGDKYNGAAEAMVYLVRFCSCVSLHAVWSGSVALLMYGNQDNLGTDDWMNFFVGIAQYLGASMVLHGLYDTLLKHELPAVALLIGIGSYLCLLWLVNRSRGT